MDHSGDLLALLMTLSENEHHIVWFGKFDGCRDRECAISDFANVTCADRTRQSDARKERFSNGVRILTSRIVIGHDDYIRALHGRSTHTRPLLSIAIATTAHNHDDPSRYGRLHGL
ncbi:unannotated protein [freshwater metagenome]|uniref:Unannotated protein n=1 Tax=freshwater metagenome TaxID=449393 RepID=A0A6J7I2Q2_9ZZZZ